MATNARALARALAPGGRFAYGVLVWSRDADGESRVAGSSKAAPIAAMSASISSMCSRLTVSQFEATGEEDADELRSKNAQLLAEYEAVVGDLAQAESQRDASKREVSRAVVH